MKMKRTIGLAAAVLAALVLPLATSAAKSPKSDDLTIAVKPNPVIFGQKVTVSGKLKGTLHSAVPVTLQEKPAPFTDDFEAVATATTATNGDYSFGGVKPSLNTRYRVVTTLAPPAASVEVLVPVQIKVVLRLSDYTPVAGQRVRFHGTAAPQHDGRLVYIQRQTATGKWRTVARTALRDAGTDFSKFSRSMRVRRDSTYRARVFHDADHADGTSRVKRAYVH
jgi:hypothetical protein